MQKLNKKQVEIIFDAFEEDGIEDEIKIAFQNNPYLSSIRVIENLEWKHIKIISHQLFPGYCEFSPERLKKMFVFFEVDGKDTFMVIENFHKMMKDVHEQETNSV